MKNLLLSLLYFLVVVPLALLVRVFHDPLSRRLDRGGSTTYWSYVDAETRRRGAR